jgi:2-polyprenyl-3-methyl-5-hydroxy-6-metoxy-1,4-benzoquinol methylase
MDRRTSAFGHVRRTYDPLVASEINRAFWDERVPIHTASEFYDVEGFKAGRETLQGFELEALGDVSGRSLVHLQCHFGLDTLSWARHGARVTGLDFSAPAIEAASVLAADIGVEADFVCADVYDAVKVFDGRSFDIVYVNVGAINWLPDIRRWAGIVEALLEPGGVLFMKEVHPFSWVFSDDDLTVDSDYFEHRNHYDEPGTYTDPDAPTVHNQTEEWQHPLSEVVNAVIGAGLVLELLDEYDHQVYQQWPFMEKDGSVYRMPQGTPRLPLLYSLRARKPVERRAHQATQGR